MRMNDLYVLVKENNIYLFSISIMKSLGRG